MALIFVVLYLCSTKIFRLLFFYIVEKLQNILYQQNLVVHILILLSIDQLHILRNVVDLKKYYQIFVYNLIQIKIQIQILYLLLLHLHMNVLYRYKIHLLDFHIQILQFFLLQLLMNNQTASLLYY